MTAARENNMKTSIGLLLALVSSATVAGLGSRAAPSSAFPSPSPSASAWTLAPRAIPDVYSTTVTIEAGTEIRQYVNRDGLVFAVAWCGPDLPDMRDLLGAHVGALLARGQRSGQFTHLRLQAGGVVIVSGGRIGAFDGKAWVPELLPAGFSIDEIR